MQEAGHLPRSLTNLVLDTSYCRLLHGGNKGFIERFLVSAAGLTSEQMCTRLEIEISSCRQGIMKVPVKRKKCAFVIEDTVVGLRQDYFVKEEWLTSNPCPL